MQEYVTHALVLQKEPLRDLDRRYSFFTKRFGKVVGKATSARKIASKLAGHLEPGSLVQVRFIEKNHGNGAQIADALKYGSIAASLPDLHALAAILAEGETDLALWHELTVNPFSWSAILRLLGWDPQGAACEHCGRGAEVFYVPRQEFFCKQCASKLGRDALLLIAYAGL